VGCVALLRILFPAQRSFSYPLPPLLFFTLLSDSNFPQGVAQMWLHQEFIAELEATLAAAPPGAPPVSAPPDDGRYSALLVGLLEDILQRLPPAHERSFSLVRGLRWGGAHAHKHACTQVRTQAGG